MYLVMSWQKYFRQKFFQGLLLSNAYVGFQFGHPLDKFMTAAHIYLGKWMDMTFNLKAVDEHGFQDEAMAEVPWPSYKRVYCQWVMHALKVHNKSIMCCYNRWTVLRQDGPEPEEFLQELPSPTSELERFSIFHLSMIRIYQNPTWLYDRKTLPKTLGLKITAKNQFNSKVLTLKQSDLIAKWVRLVLSME